MRRLLTIGHSYVVSEYRRLAHEMAVAGRGEWDVTAVAPNTFPGDLRPIALEPLPGEACHVVGLDLWLAASPHLFVYRRLRSIVSRGWDVVHCWQEPYVAAGAQVARLTPAGAVFVPATFQNIVKRYPPPFRQFERSALRRSNGWIAFGETVRDAHRTRPLYADRPHRVIPPGVDVQHFSPNRHARSATRTGLGWDDDALVVGFVGRFVPEKGIGLLTRVLPRLGAKWHALFVGGGPLQPDLERFALSHPGRVRLLTTATHADVPSYLNAMDVLCAPSQSTRRWREQFGRMLVEAMACGVPIVASRSGEIPYVVDAAGILVDEHDEDAWVEAVGRVLGDAGQRRALADAGLARVHAHYSWPVVARMHLAFFTELLGR